MSVPSAGSGDGERYAHGELGSTSIGPALAGMGADRRQFLEHLILRAEAVCNFHPPAPPLPRPWWKLWGKEPVPELPAVVADLRNVA